jgi:hypothetical protein
MSTRLLLAAVATLALLVSACAPSATGSTPNAPVPASAGELSVKRGETIYVRVDYQLTDFGLAPADLRASLWIPSGYDSEVGDVSNQFGLVEPRVADGWQFELLQVRAERSSVRGSGAFDANRTAYSLWAVYRITAADDAIPGPYRLRGTLNARGAGSQSVSLTVAATP